jgi:hypothetical protein
MISGHFVADIGENADIGGGNNLDGRACYQGRERWERLRWFYIPGFWSIVFPHSFCGAVFPLFKFNPGPRIQVDQFQRSTAFQVPALPSANSDHIIGYYWLLLRPNNSK